MKTRYLMKPDRLWALTDGVFAIAITLLVIEIAIPLVEAEGGADELLDALIDRWPSFLSYLLGFLAIGVWWLSIHSMGTLLEHVDHIFLTLGIVFLLGIGFVPFTAGFLAEYMGSPHEQQRIAVVGFAAWQLLIALSYHASWRYAVRKSDLFFADIDRSEVKRTLNWYSAGPLAWLVLIGVALLNSTLAIVLTLISAFSWLIWAGVPPHRQRSKQTKTA